MERKMKDTGIEWIGEIPVEWKIVKVKHLVETIGSGGTPNTDALNFYDGPFSWIQSGDLYHKVHITNTEKTLTADGAKSMTALRLYKHDFVVLAMYGASVGNVAISRINAYVNQACCVLKSVKLETNFLYYSLLIAKEYLINQAFGGTQPNISQIIVKNTPITFPNFEEQNRIVSFLNSRCSKIDSMIQDAETQIQILENYKKSLITETVTHGLDKNVPLKDTGIEWIGKIPEEWNVKKVKYVANLEGRIGWEGLTSDEYTDEGPYLITGIDFVGGKIDWEHCVHISEERWRIGESVQIHEGDLLITKDGTVGKVAIADDLHEKASLNSGVLLITPFNGLLRRYFFWVLKSEVFWEWFSLDNAGNSTIIHLYQNAFDNFSFPLPSAEEQRKIYGYLDSKCSKIDSMILKQRQAVETLKKYKKSLIYEYVTGKKRVEE